MKKCVIFSKVPVLVLCLLGLLINFSICPSLCYGASSNTQRGGKKTPPALIGGAPSKSYYVAKTGSDSNSGTAGSPFATIQYAINLAGCGDFVHVTAGIYNENIVMKSGVSVLGNSPSDTTIMGIASGQGTAYFNNIQNAVLKGFKITVGTPSAGLDHGVVFEGSSTDNTAVLENCIITNTQYGIFIWYSAKPTVQNNTLVGNLDEQGIYIDHALTAPVIRNNIVTGYSYQGIHVVGGTPTIEYNDVWNNSPNYQGITDPTGSSGNISADPKFVSASDFHFSIPLLSPCIDQGNPASQYNDYNKTRNDMGAYGGPLLEAAFFVAPPPFGSDLNAGTSAAPFATIQKAINTVVVGAVNVSSGTYNENITMKGGISVIGNSPSDTTISGTASISGVVNFTNVTNATLKGFKITVGTPVQGTDRGVVFSGTDITTVLENCIITNVQYGMFLYSAARIQNNTLVANSDEQGIYIQSGAASPVIHNNIITGYAFEGIHVVSGTPVVQYNDVWNNAPNFLGMTDPTTPISINGNISLNPLFVSAGDFRLGYGSPAIDAGDPALQYDDYDGTQNNMGAYGGQSSETVNPLPAIGVSPANLTFTANYGGPNPANQNINVSNTCGDVLRWTANDDGTWLSLSPQNGTNDGTVAASVNISGLTVGTHNASITIDDLNATNGPVGVPVSLVVNCPTISVSPTFLPGGTANLAYSQTITSSSGMSPYTYAVTTGLLPAGLTLSSGGTLSGTPTATGTFNFTVTATDSNNCTGTRAYSLVVNCPTITASPASLPGGTANLAYSQTITASGGVGSYTYSLSTGSLPAGISLTTGGVLSGATTLTGTFNFTVKATDANTCIGSQAYILNILAAVPFGSRIYVANANSNNMSVIDANTNTVIATIPVGAGPMDEFEVNPLSRRIYVPNHSSHNVSVVDIDTNTLVTTFSTGNNAPDGAAMNPYTHKAYISHGLTLGVVSVINTDTNSSSTIASVGNGPNGVALFPAISRAYVPNSPGGTVTVINTDTDTIVTSISIGSPAYGVKVHPAAHRVYVSHNGNSVSVINTDTNTVVATIPVGTGTRNIALHPSANRLYVANYTSNSVSVIDTTTNTVINTITTGLGTGPYGIAVNESAYRVYVSNATSNNVSVIDSITNNVIATIPVGTTPTGVAVNNALVTQQPKFAYTTNAGPLSNNISLFTINPGTGALNFVENATAGTEPRSIAVDPTGRFAYAANYVSNDISVYTINQTSGALTAGTTVGAGTQPFFVAADPTGKFLYAANYGSNNISVYTINQTNGALTWVEDKPAGSGPTSVAVDPTGWFAYAGNYGGNISVYTINRTTGALIPGSPVATVAAGTSPDTVTVDPTGRFLYAANYGSNNVSVFKINQATGALTAVETEAAGAKPHSIMVDPSGRFVYTANEDTGDVSVYRIDQATGALIPGSAVASGLWPSSVAVEASGRYAYVSNNGSDNVVRFAIDQSTGALTGATLFGAGDAPVFITTTSGLYGFVCTAITVSPATLPNGTNGTAYSQSITASNGTEPYTYTIISGSLPTGLSLSSGGLLSGTPSVAGMFNFIVTATDANGCTGTMSYSLTINKGTQATVTLTGVPGTANVGGTFTAVAGGGSGTGAYSYALTGTACTVNPATGAGLVTHVSGGCSVTATRALDVDYNAASSAASAITTINKGTQATVTLTGVPGTANVGGTFTAVAGGGSGTGAYSYALTGTACTVTPATGAGLVTHVSGGCSVTATRALDVDYNAASSAASAITTINKGTQATVTLTGVPGTANVGGTFTAVAGGGNGTGAYSYALTGTACTVNPATGAGLVTHVSGGCSVTATRALDVDYNAASSAASAITTINKGTQATVTLTGVPGTANVGGTFTAVAGGGSGTGAYSYALTGTACTVNPATGAGLVTHVSGGCSVTATRALDVDYNAASSAASAITTINKGTQATLTAVATPSTVVYGSTSTLSSTGGSGTGAVTFSAGASTGCSVAGTTLSVTSTSGTCSITATKATDIDYNAATSAGLAVTLQKATATVTLGNLIQYYDGTPKPVTNTTSPSGLTTTMLYNGSASVPSAAGTYPVSATVSNANYQGSATGTLQIKNTYTYSVSKTGNGTITSSPAGLTCGATSCTGEFPLTASVTLYFRPATGSRVVSVTVNGVSFGAVNSVTLKGLKTPPVIVVVFNP